MSKLTCLLAIALAPVVDTCRPPVAVVPEPATVVTLAAGLVVIAVYALLKRAAKS